MDRTRLAVAKAEAEALFASAGYDVLFRQYLATRRGIPPERVVFHRDAACRRIREAALLSVRESAERRDAIEGETDGETIWIVRGLDHDQMVGVLLHEALHDTAFVARATRAGAEKGLSCEEEHRFLELVGL